MVNRYWRRAGGAGVRDTLFLAHALAVRPRAVAWRPQAAKVEITTRCNIHCSFCHLAEAEGGAARAGHWMPIDEFRTVLDQLPGIRWIDIQGVGEPLSHPQIEELLDELNGRGVRAELTTNGVLLAPAIVDRLFRGTFRLTLSLPAARAETWRLLTGSDAFERVITNARRLIEQRKGKEPLVRVSHVPLAPSLVEMEGIVDRVAEIGADQLLIGRYQPSGPDDPLTPDRGLLTAALLQARTRAASLGVAIEVNDVPLAGDGPSAPERCHWPWSVPMIDVTGELRPCCYAPRGPSLGNLAEAPFATLWNGPAIQRFRGDLAGGRLAGLPCATCQEIP